MPTEIGRENKEHNSETKGSTREINQPLLRFQCQAVFFFSEGVLKCGLKKGLDTRTDVRQNCAKEEHLGLLFFSNANLVICAEVHTLLRCLSHFMTSSFIVIVRNLCIRVCDP